jgi:apolipoprotein N-acyltransferase
MPRAVSDYFHQPLLVGFAIFLIVTGFMAAPYYAAFATAYPPLVRRLRVATPLLVGAAWAAAEVARGRLFNGTLAYVGNSPWATFGYSQAGILPIVQIASITGVYGISFILASVNAAVAEVVWAVVRRRGVDPRAWRGFLVATGSAALVYGWGALLVWSAPHEPTAAPVSVAIAQADLGAATRWGSDGPARTLEAYQRLTREAFELGRPEIVFWPEAAVTFFLEQDEIYRGALARALRDHEAELVLGAPRSVGPGGVGPHTNSVYLLASDGAVVARYDKEYLLPFMEYFPLRIEMARRRFGRIREFTPGALTPPLPTRAGKAGILVCNEALLPHVAAQRIADGAVYLVNPSNDSWVPDAGFAWQQFDIVALRAVEQRAYLLRVSDSGPSGVIDPFGRIVAHSEAQTRAVLLATIAPTVPGSVYARLGDLFGGVCLLATALALVSSRRG